MFVDVGVCIYIQPQFESSATFFPESTLCRFNERFAYINGSAGEAKLPVHSDRLTYIETIAVSIFT